MRREFIECDNCGCLVSTLSTIPEIVYIHNQRVDLCFECFSELGFIEAYNKIALQGRVPIVEYSFENDPWNNGKDCTKQYITVKFLKEKQNGGK